jgi:hypothetical protein
MCFMHLQLPHTDTHMCMQCTPTHVHRQRRRTRGSYIQATATAALCYYNADILTCFSTSYTYTHALMLPKRDLAPDQRVQPNTAAAAAVISRVCRWVVFRVCMCVCVSRPPRGTEKCHAASPEVVSNMEVVSCRSNIPSRSRREEGRWSNGVARSRREKGRKRK